MEWVPIIGAVLGSGACSSAVTYALTRRERREKEVVSRSDLADKLDKLIEQKMNLEAEVSAERIEKYKMTGKLEAHEKLLVSVIETQGASKEREERCQEHLSALSLEVHDLRGRLSLFETANQVINSLRNEPATQ